MSEIKILGIEDAQVYENEELTSRRVLRREHDSPSMSLNVSTLHEGFNDPNVNYPEHDEIVYMLSGTVKPTFGGSTKTVIAGKAIYVPRGETYGYEVTEGPNEAIAVFSPAKY